MHLKVACGLSWDCWAYKPMLCYVSRRNWLRKSSEVNKKQRYYKTDWWNLRCYNYQEVSLCWVFERRFTLLGTNSFEVYFISHLIKLLRGLFRGWSVFSSWYKKASQLKNCEALCLLVGTVGFELTTPCTPCKCATRLRYAPRIEIIAGLESNVNPYFSWVLGRWLAI